eukprot:EG_transcript_15493
MPAVPITDPALSLLQPVGPSWRGAAVRAAGSALLALVAVGLLGNAVGAAELKVLPGLALTSARSWGPSVLPTPPQGPRPAVGPTPLRRPVARAAAEGEGGLAGQAEHKVAAPPQFTEEQLRMRQALQQHQKEAARLTNAEEARNLMQYGSGYGVLSTNSIKQPGYPAGSVILFAVDAEGRPVFSFSAMSTHTQDLQKDAKASLVVTVDHFKGVEDGRITFLGDVQLVPEAEVGALHAVFKARHPSAWWVDVLGDLSWWRMERIAGIRFVWGFARAGAIDPAEYAATKPDPIAAFAKPVLTHMNEDHADSNRAIVNHYVPIKVDSAAIVGLDRLGMDMRVVKDGTAFQLRVPFVREAADRKAVKDILVEMTRTAAAAAAAATAAQPEF